MSLDLWQAMERGGAIELRDALAEQRLDRDRVHKAMHLIAIGKNRNASVPMPSFGGFEDRWVRQIAEATLSEYRDL
jgi:hypothetical protein